MRKEIYSAFDSVHASRELKDRTRAFTARRQASRPRTPRLCHGAAAPPCGAPARVLPAGAAAETGKRPSLGKIPTFLPGKGARIPKRAKDYSPKTY